MMKKLLGILLIISLFLSGCCEERNAYKQFNLGVMYDQGKGVEQDYKQAVYWYKKSAEQGYANAQYNLGVRYYNGDGVTRDIVKSYMWVSISAYSGHLQASKGKDLISKKMTSEQITQAQGMARKWVEKFEKRKKE